MAAIRVNKIEAARRQIETAIKLLFDNCDPVSVHTLAAAGGRILRDICNQKKTPLDQAFKAMIRPGKEKEFLAAVNMPANFFKHADKDADAILENVDEEINELVLFWACGHYSDLGYSLTPPMATLWTWFAALHPEFLLDGPMKEIIASKNLDWFRQADRMERLKWGKTLLAGNSSRK